MKPLFYLFIAPITLLRFVYSTRAKPLLPLHILNGHNYKDNVVSISGKPGCQILLFHSLTMTWAVCGYQFKCVRSLQTQSSLIDCQGQFLQGLLHGTVCRKYLDKCFEFLLPLGLPLQGWLPAPSSPESTPGLETSTCL